MKKYIDVDVDEITEEEALEIFKKKGATKIRNKTTKLINRVVENINNVNSEYVKFIRCLDIYKVESVDVIETISKVSPISYLDIEVIYYVHLTLSNITDKKLKELDRGLPYVDYEIVLDFVGLMIDIEEDLEELYRILRLLEKAEKQKMIDKIKLEISQAS